MKGVARGRILRTKHGLQWGPRSGVSAERHRRLPGVLVIGVPIVLVNGAALRVSADEWASKPQRKQSHGRLRSASIGGGGARSGDDARENRISVHLLGWAPPVASMGPALG